MHLTYLINLAFALLSRQPVFLSQETSLLTEKRINLRARGGQALELIHVHNSHLHLELIEEGVKDFACFVLVVAVFFVDYLYLGVDL